MFISLLLTTLLACSPNDAKPLARAVSASAQPTRTAPAMPETRPRVSSMAQRPKALPEWLDWLHFTSEGDARTAAYHVPSGTPPEGGWPVIIAFHGGGDGHTSARIAKWWESAKNGDYILVFPNAYDGIWRAHGIGGDGPDVRPMMDVHFVERLIDELGQKAPIDKSNLFSTGFSNGAILTWEIGCQTKLLKAMAPVSLSMSRRMIERCSPDHPLPVHYLHGTADTQAPYEGGRTAGVPVTSAQETLRFWVKKNQCTSGDPKPQPRPTPAGAAVQVIDYRFEGCAADTEFVQLKGGAHSWPGAGNKQDKAGYTDQFSATAEIIAFFDRQRTPEPSK